MKTVTVGQVSGATNECYMPQALADVSKVRQQLTDIHYGVHTYYYALRA